MSLLNNGANLGQLIEYLKSRPSDEVWSRGFMNPHSYRGYYEELAFEPAENTSVAEMLAAARGALGEVFEGYKGGDYKMTLHTGVWLASYGLCGIPIVFPNQVFMLRGDG